MTNLNRFPDEKLQALKTVLDLKAKVFSSGDIGEALKLKGEKLGGKMTAILQVQIDGEDLLLSVGPKNRQMNFVFNSKISPEKKNIFLKEIEQEISRRKSLMG